MKAPSKAGRFALVGICAGALAACNGMSGQPATGIERRAGALSRRHARAGGPLARPDARRGEDGARDLRPAGQVRRVHDVHERRAPRLDLRWSASRRSTCIKEIPVYAPNSWQGWASGTDEGTDVLKEGTFAPGDKSLPTQTWGDLHHPQISLTNGKYDGELIVSTDKSAGRVAITRLRDFKTKQIFKIPNTISDHSRRLHRQPRVLHRQHVPALPGRARAATRRSRTTRTSTGARSPSPSSTARPARSISPNSFQIELPPYFQDLSPSAGPRRRAGFFINSMNTEMATGGDLEGKPPMEIGASQHEMDYLHVIDWKEVEAFVQSKDPKTSRGQRHQGDPARRGAGAGLHLLRPRVEEPARLST